MTLRRVGRGDARGRVAARSRRGRDRRATATRQRRSTAPTFAIRALESRVAPGGREQVAFYLAVGPERDGAEATARRPAPARVARAARRRRATRCRALEQSTGHEAIDRLINRNLLFAYFYARRPRARRRAVLSRAHARAVERARRHGARLGSAHVDDSGGAARRSAARARAAAAHVRAARLRAGPRRALSRRHAVRAGLRARGRRRRIAIATDRYIRDTGDDRVVDEPALADTLYLRRRGSRRAARQAHSAVLDGGEPVGRAGGAPVHAARERGGGAGARRACGARSTKRRREDCRIPTRCAPRSTAISSSTTRTGKHVDVRVGDRSRGRDVDGATIRRRRRSGCRCTRRCARQDSTYRRTVQGDRRDAAARWRSSARGSWARTRRTCCSGCVARRSTAGSRPRWWTRTARAVANGGDASLSGLLAWAAWYAVNALGERP